MLNLLKYNYLNSTTHTVHYILPKYQISIFEICLICSLLRTIWTSLAECYVIMFVKILHQLIFLRRSARGSVRSRKIFTKIIFPAGRLSCHYVHARLCLEQCTVSKSESSNPSNYKPDERADVLTHEQMDDGWTSSVGTVSNVGE